MLSSQERKYLEGNFKPEKDYKWKLNHKIRRKTFQSMKDLSLVFEKMSAKLLHLTREAYMTDVVPMLIAIYQAACKERFYQEVPWDSLAIALSIAGKPFNWKRLYEDEGYRWSLISWLAEHERKTGKKYFHTFTLEERKNLYVTLFKSRNNVEALKQLKQPEPSMVFVKDKDGDPWLITTVKLHGV